MVVGDGNPSLRGAHRRAGQAVAGAAARFVSNQRPAQRARPLLIAPELALPTPQPGDAAVLAAARQRGRGLDPRVASASQAAGRRWAAAARCQARGASPSAGGMCPKAKVAPGALGPAWAAARTMAAQSGRIGGLRAHGRRWWRQKRSAPRLTCDGFRRGAPGGPAACCQVRSISIHACCLPGCVSVAVMGGGARAREPAGSCVAKCRVRV